MNYSQVLQRVRYIWQHPANRQHRLRSLLRAVGWQLSKRLRGGSRDVVMPGGMRVRCYPDSQSATLLLYCGGLYDYHEMRFVRDYLRPGDGFLDIGANVGIYTLLAASRVGTEGHIDAFEPVPSTLSRLRENLQLNGITNVQVHAVAVGDEPGRVRFEAGQDAMNHMLRSPRAGDDCEVPATSDEPRIITQLAVPETGVAEAGVAETGVSETGVAETGVAETGVSQTGVSEAGVAEAALSVPCVVLDQHLAGRRYALGKIDIEGAEPLALRGAARMLSRANPPVWLLEMNGLSHRFGVTERQFEAQLERAGYDLAWYDSDRRELVFRRGLWQDHDNVLAVARSHLEQVTDRIESADGEPDRLVAIGR